MNCTDCHAALDPDDYLGRGCDEQGDPLCESCFDADVARHGTLGGFRCPECDEIAPIAGKVDGLCAECDAAATAEYRSEMRYLRSHYATGTYHD